MRIFTKPIIIAFMSLLSLLLPSEARAEKIVILATNDTHSLIDAPAGPAGMGGAARRKAVIDSVRAANPGRVLVVDAGDVVQGTLYFNLYFGKVEEQLMNALGYDVRILGNHEFDNGMDSLAAQLKGAEAALVCTNYQFRGTPLEDTFSRYHIATVGDKRIGFLGINLQPEGMISRRNFTGMRYTDAIKAANSAAAFLKDVEEVDAVVALTHIGYDRKTPSDPLLAENSKDIDLIIGGHSHTLLDPAGNLPTQILNAEGRPVTITQAGKDGKYIAEITLDTDDLQAPPAYRLIPVDARLDDRLDPAVAAIIEPYRAAVDSLNSVYIATVPHELPHRCTELVNFAADFIEHTGRQLAPDVDFAVSNVGSLRHALPKGKLSEGETITLMPFFNKVQVLDMPGRSVIALFDSIAAYDTGGVSAQIKAVADAQARTCPVLLFNGKEIDPERTYRIATVDYLAEGGDYMTPFTEGTLVAEDKRYVFERLVDYVKAKGKVQASPKPRITAKN